jgi:hypothetical protein
VVEKRAKDERGKRARAKDDALPRMVDAMERQMI